MNIASFIALIAAILAAFLSFRYQQRLKAFELLLGRRESVLKDIENLIERLYAIKAESDGKEKKHTKQYLSKFFHNGLIIFQKSKSANFGKSANIMADTFWAIIQEPLIKQEEFDFSCWVDRTLNVLAALYTIANSAMNDEIETISLPIHKQVVKYFKKRKLQKEERKKMPNKAPPKAHPPSSATS